MHSGSALTWSIWETAAYGSEGCIMIGSRGSCSV